MKHLSIIILLIYTVFNTNAQVIKTIQKLPDTGQKTSYTNTFGEDNDYTINPPSFTLGKGIVTDNVTTLMWQQADGGEMTYENALKYCDTLTLGGFTDWRLPTAQEAYTILNHQFPNPALDVAYFPKTNWEYIWTSNVQPTQTTKVWVINGGGGIGNHLKTETISAGGTKRYHVKAVRNTQMPISLTKRFTDNQDGTVTDNLTDLVWQKTPNSTATNWEGALQYAENLTLAGKNDWRLPNIKELHSLNDESIVSPSIDTKFFPTIGVKKYWSSTSLPNQTTKAWYLDTQFGITTYDTKTNANFLICVSGKSGVTAIKDKQIEENIFTVFPNPTNDVLNIHLNNDISEQTINEISLFDTQGKKVFSSDKYLNSIDLRGFERGVYLLKVGVGGSFLRRKVVKE